ncbi:MAG: geranylgeranylglycerol-phosphate geranylgeranyltransferase [Pleurocapsa sp. MO_226.B13]|nr:geranylgeranylglycerol-phosphate geranylgeranyltransferase [Pleurocapsa sp. MO_226.B13]
MVSTRSSRDSSNRIRVIHAFAQLFRPILGILAALAGCATIYALNPATQPQQYLLTATVLICMTSASFAIDDYWDVEQDRINHAERPLPSGCLSPRQAWWAAVLLFTCAAIAAIPLGLYPFILVAVSTVLLWNYSHLLTYSGIFGNAIVAAIVAALIFLGSLVAARPWGMLYPICFLFCYILAKEIIWDVHDTEGDRAQDIVTVANRWGTRTAFSIAWGLLGILMVSIPIALWLLPMAHPLLFIIFSPIVPLSLAIALIRYQQQRSLQAYRGLSLWGRLGMLLGVIGLLGTAAPL